MTGEAQVFVQSLLDPPLDLGLGIDEARARLEHNLLHGCEGGPYR